MPAVILSEVDGGIISHYHVLAGNPSDVNQWQPSLEQHIQQLGQAPDQASADRGVYSGPNETTAGKLGVKQVILPKPGYRSVKRQEHEQ